MSSNAAGSDDICFKLAARVAAENAVTMNAQLAMSLIQAKAKATIQVQTNASAVSSSENVPPYEDENDPLDAWVAAEIEAKRLDREEVLAQRAAQEARAKAFADAHRERRRKKQPAAAASDARREVDEATLAGNLPAQQGPLEEAVYTEALATAQLAMKLLQDDASHAMTCGHDATSGCARVVTLLVEDAVFLALSPRAQLAALQQMPTSAFVTDPHLGLTAPPRGRAMGRHGPHQDSIASPPPRDRATCVLAQAAAAGNNQPLSGSAASAAAQRQAATVETTLQALPTADAAALAVELRLRGDYTDALGAMEPAAAAALRAELAGGGQPKTHPWFGIARASPKQQLSSQPGLSASRLLA